MREDGEFIEKLVVLVAVAAVAAYIYYAAAHFADAKAFELGNAGGQSFSASDQIRSAKVAVSNAKGYSPCQASQSGDIRRCSSGDWSYVGEVGKWVDGRLRKCVWAHPISGRTIRISYEGAEVGSTISGFFGLADGSTVENQGTVNFTVSQDGRLAYEGSIADQGATEFSFGSEPGTRSIEFAVSTDNDRRRYFCFDAWSSRA